MKVFKRPRKPTAEKSKSENPRRKRPIVGKYGIQSTKEMAFKRTVTSTRVFDFPPLDLMRPRYCRSADSRMRMQNALLFYQYLAREDKGGREGIPHTHPIP